ncbi:hypothetical protein O6H91_16G072200 [Diphasiastrum complanatum]|uniref:Uncharacterized protein n=1 Tax=Diphasiastrum complanatum TaxID=34168 RepID=A0ACC2BDI2_DIPCM|nr:hypothetical protein O6H91_16G072200 [Diphasiastrum complanatum]
MYNQTTILNNKHSKKPPPPPPGRRRTPSSLQKPHKPRRALPTYKSREEAEPTCERRSIQVQVARRGGEPTPEQRRSIQVQERKKCCLAAFFMIVNWHRR